MRGTPGDCREGRADEVLYHVHVPGTYNSSAPFISVQVCTHARPRSVAGTRKSVAISGDQRSRARPPYRSACWAEEGRTAARFCLGVGRACWAEVASKALARTFRAAETLSTTVIPGRALILHSAYAIRSCRACCLCCEAQRKGTSWCQGIVA